MEEFLRKNRETYDALALEYQERVTGDVLNDLPLVFRVWSHASRRFRKSVALLDLGCGHGVNLAMFSRLGAKTTGLDFSQPMVDVARRVSPDSEFLVEEFLSADLQAGAFDVVFAKAFLHLFPRTECDRVIAKIRHVLTRDGLIYFATTWSDRSYEGYQVKRDYSGEHQRFRRVWSHEDLREACSANGLAVIDEWQNVEASRKKRWLNLIAEVRDA